MGKCLIFAMCCCYAGVGAGASTRDEPDWFDEDPQAVFDAINDGELKFLVKLPDRPVHHHHNSLTVTRDSISTGWVGLRQCHEHLDQFPSAQIVYHRSRVKNLRLVSYQNIGQAYVEDSSVQLKQIGADAGLCIEAKSQALRLQADGTYLMKNGPFMRKFLDGYFPMRVSMDISLPDALEFVGIEPEPQNGFDVRLDNKGLHLDAWFEGRLETRIRFRLKPGIAGWRPE